jgi:flagellar biosynthesis protein
MADPRPPARPGAEAVAVRWRKDRDGAPKITAKGRGLMAERILALAREHGIPMHEDRDLVTLLGALDLGVEVPPHLYKALAEILAHVYRANRRLAEGKRGAGPGPG